MAESGVVTDQSQFYSIEFMFYLSTTLVDNYIPIVSMVQKFEGHVSILLGKRVTVLPVATNSLSK